MRLFFSISFIIVSIALFFVFTDPLYGDIRLLNTQVSKYSTALGDSTKLQNTRDTLIGVYKNVLPEDKTNLAHFLPTTIGNIELILEIEKIANIYGMPLKDIKFETKSLEQGIVNSSNSVVVAEKDPADYLPYGVFPMEFVIDGRYDTFMTFLNELEHNLRLVDVKSISFSVPTAAAAGGATGTAGAGAGTDATSSNIYSFTLKIEIYWLK